MKASKRILAICLSLVVLLVALPLVPFGAGASAEEVVAEKYTGGANFKIVNTYSVNSFPAEGGVYPHTGADTGASVNPEYYGGVSGDGIAYEFDAEKGAGKYSYASSVASTAQVRVKILPKSNINMVSFHMDATNVSAAANDYFEALIAIGYRNMGDHTQAASTPMYFKPDGSDDIEVIYITAASSAWNQKARLRAGMSGTYYIPASAFGPTTVEANGYANPWEGAAWQNLTDDALVNGENWWMDSGTWNHASTNLTFSKMTLQEGDYFYIDDLCYLEVEDVPTETVMNEYFVVKNEYNANVFAHTSLQHYNDYGYDPGAFNNAGVYGSGEGAVSYSYDAAKGAAKYSYAASDSATSTYNYIKAFSKDGVNMLSVHMDLTNVPRDNGVLNARLNMAVYSRGHNNVGGSFFYFLPDATEENPYPSIEKIQIPTSNSVWNVRVPLQAGRAGTYYFPEEVFGIHDEATCGYTNGAEGYNDAWDTFDHNEWTNTDGTGGNGWYLNSGNYWRNYLGISYFSLNEGEYFYVDDLKWVEAAATGSMLETPAAGTSFVQDTATGNLESKDIIRDTINSVEVWVNTTATTEGWILTNKWPYTTKLNYHNGAEEVWVKMTADGNPYFHMSDGEGHWIDWTLSDVTINNGQWNHLAFVKDDAAKKVYFYMNGFLKSAFDFEAFADVNLTQELLIGHRMSGLSSTGYFDGQIADVRLWTDARSAEEIFAGVTDYANLDKAGLVARYALQGDYKEDVNGNDLVVYDMQITADETGYAAYKQEVLDAVAEGGYTIAFLPDTQCTNWYNPSHLDNPYNWIIDNKDAFNIKAVMSLGDITEKSYDEEWARAGEQFGRLTEAGIAWTVIQGNHDYNGCSPGGRKYDGFNATFTPSTVPNIQNGDWSFELGGTFFENEVSSAYYYLTVGDVEYMLLCLEMEPGTCVVQWADQVLKANCDKRVIITTHGYLDSYATRMDRFLDENGNKIDNYHNSLCYGVGVSGEELWNKLIKNNPNVEMIVCGHIGSVPIQYRVDKNDAGKDVLQVLMDTQGLDTANPPAAVVGLATFSADGKSVSFKYYAAGTYENGKDQYNSADDTVIPEASEGWFIDSNSNELSFDLDATTSEYVDKSMTANEGNYNAADLTIGETVSTFDGFIATNSNGWRNPYYALYGSSTVDKVKWDNGRAAMDLTDGNVISLYMHKLPNFVPINGETVKAIAVNFDASATTEAVSFRWNMTVPDVQSVGFEGRDYNSATAVVKSKYILVWDNGDIQELEVGGQRLTLPAGFKGQVVLPLDNNYCCWLSTGGANVLMSAEDFASEVAANNVSISIQSHCSKADTTVYVDNLVYLTDLGQLTHTVAVKDRNGNTIKLIQAENGEKIPAEALPAAPDRYGYEFKGWANTELAITGNVVATPVYEKAADKFQVFVPYEATVTYPNNQDYVLYDDRVTITTPETDGLGNPFAYWEANGDIFRYNRTTSFLVFGNMEMNAVYSADTFEATVVYTNTMPIVSDNGNGTFNMHVMGAVSVPEGVNVTEIGIVLAAGEWTAAEVINGTAGTTYKLPLSSPQVNRQFLYTIKNIARGQIRTAVTYAVIDGVTVYSNAACAATKSVIDGVYSYSVANEMGGSVTHTLNFDDGAGKWESTDNAALSALPEEDQEYFRNEEPESIIVVDDVEYVAMMGDGGYMKMVKVDGTTVTVTTNYGDVIVLEYDSAAGTMTVTNEGFFEAGIVLEKQ